MCSCLAVSLAHVCSISLQPIGCTSVANSAIEAAVAASGANVSVMPLTFLPFFVRFIARDDCPHNEMATHSIIIADNLVPFNRLNFF